MTLAVRCDVSPFWENDAVHFCSVVVVVAAFLLISVKIIKHVRCRCLFITLVKSIYFLSNKIRMDFDGRIDWPMWFIHSFILNDVPHTLIPPIRLSHLFWERRQILSRIILRCLKSRIGLSYFMIDINWGRARALFYSRHSNMLFKRIIISKFCHVAH